MWSQAGRQASYSIDALLEKDVRGIVHCIDHLAAVRYEQVLDPRDLGLGVLRLAHQGLDR